MFKRIKLWIRYTTFTLLFISADSFSQEIDPLTYNIVSANTTFGFKLFKELTHQNGKSNIFISPLSISIALVMIYNGATGETERAIAKTLELEGISLEEVNRSYAMLMDRFMNLEDVQLNLANSFWADRQVKFKENFLNDNQKYYDAEITNLDLSRMSSLERINRWIRDKTQGKISKMLAKEDLDAILFIVDTVYFKGVWTVGFSKEHTRDGDFTLLDGRKKSVPMMMSQSDRYTYTRGDDFQAVGLPYGNENVTMYLFLPDEESSLQEFRKKLNRKNWEAWMEQFRREFVRVTLPSLQIANEITLNQTLKAVGMGIAFTSHANFERMCYGPAWIDWVKHNACIDVNEEGTEAAAVTVVKMKRGGLNRIVFDRPFFCAIRDNETGAILFMGSIVEP